jgi:hypothetical protein
MAQYEMCSELCSLLLYRDFDAAVFIASVLSARCTEEQFSELTDPSDIVLASYRDGTASTLCNQADSTANDDRFPNADMGHVTGMTPSA